MSRPLSKLERREMSRTFKERKPSRGIFAIRGSDPTRIWVGSTMNLHASRNTVAALVARYSLYDEVLQQQLCAHGAECFRYQILEELDPELSGISVRDILDEKKRGWASRLSARAIG